MKLFALAVILLAPALRPASAQQEPLLGLIRVSVEEPVIEGRQPRVTVMLATVGEYGCGNFTIATRERRAADTIEITLRGLAPTQLCDDSFGSAQAGILIDVKPMQYVLAITRGQSTDRLRLAVTPTRLSVRSDQGLTFLKPDTSAFSRPSAHSFLVSCGTPNVPELCEDLAGWFARLPGIVARPLAANEKIGFPRYAGSWHDDYRLFEYQSDRAFRPVRRCFRFLADTLEQAVGVGVTLQTADGEVLRAWSRRALHEPHIPVPRKISGSSGCPGD